LSLSLENIDVAYAEQPVLNSVSLQIAAPSLVGVIGPNGAGKTTLLKSIAGLTGASGRVSLDSKRLDDQPIDVIARTVAYCAQSSVPAWPVTVKEIVRLGRLPHRNDSAGRSRDTAAVEHAIARMDLSKLVHRRIDALSGGELSRALLARALCTQAPVLLVDEPTADLDPWHELKTMEVLRDEAGNGVHILAVLHNLSLAARFCDSLVVLRNGRVEAVGTPLEVLTPALLSNVYGIDALIEQREDSVFVMPWRRIDQAE
jgi:iron complex transport system ATP-binding protein